MSNKNVKRENKILTISLSSGLSVLVLIAFFVGVYAIGYEPGIERDETEAAEEQDMFLSFDAGSYEALTNSDVNLQDHLNKKGLSENDVLWSSNASKEDMFVGQSGHIVMNKNEKNYEIYAAAKADPSVRAKCKIGTPSVKEEQKYKVETLNGLHKEDEVVKEDTVLLATRGDSEHMVSTEIVRFQPQPRPDIVAWDPNVVNSLDEANEDVEVPVNQYDCTKKKFMTAEDLNDVEYIVYKHPDTENIAKILCIETNQETGDETYTEYYYSPEEKISYITTYDEAPDSQTGNGEANEGYHFYFANDAMIGWRSDAPDLQQSYCYSETEKARMDEQYGEDTVIYADCSIEEKNIYDSYESDWINSAYCILDKAKDENATGISTISGFVVDEDENAMQNVQVSLQDATSKEEAFQTTTDENGFYEITMPVTEVEYNLQMTSADFISQIIYELKTNEGEVELVQEDVCMIPSDETEREITIKPFDALNKADSGEGMKPLKDVTIEIREGMNHRTGDPMISDTADGKSYKTKLAAGIYTIHLTKEKYVDLYTTITVSEGTSDTVEAYMTPKLGENEMRIVLTWGSSPSDLDSHLYANVGSKKRHICFWDKNGDGSEGVKKDVPENLDVDDTDSYGPETVTIKDASSGTYKYYVYDYSNYSYASSYQMSNSGATVRVYGAEGLMQTFHIVKDKKAITWEVFHIVNGNIVPVNHYGGESMIDGHEGFHW